jgi:hypothetical protein
MGHGFTPGDSMPASHHVKVSLPAELAAAALSEAREQGRSLSSVIAEAVAARYSERARLLDGLRELQEVELVNLKLALAAFRSVSALVAMAPRIEDDGRRAEITGRAAEHRAAILAHLGLREDELLGLAGDAAG